MNTKKGVIELKWEAYLEKRGKQMKHETKIGKNNAKPKEKCIWKKRRKLTQTNNTINENKGKKLRKIK